MNKVACKITFTSFLSLILLISFIQLAHANSAINWDDWSEDIFKKSSNHKKLVILNLEAVWCHWCHVMEEKTYRDKEVIELLNSKFISIKVDQDSRPDLSNRYKDYGWPATIIFDSNGKELSKRAGYINPEEMKNLLTKLIKNPIPEKNYQAEVSNFSENAVISNSLKEKLETQHYSAYDYNLGGLKLAQKYLEADSTEYSIIKSAKMKDREMAIKTLDANLKIHDPVWGGVYQYSTHYDWDHPHFEKIMRTQTNNLRIYALAANFFDDSRYLEAANQIYNYINSFLKDQSTGAFYTSQDADVVKGEHSAEYFKLGDTERRKIGIPAIDKHSYSRENGWGINSITSLYQVTQDPDLIETAKKAASWIIANRKIGQGFSHDAKDQAGPFLGDNLAMGQALLSLHRVTAERSWLTQAEDALIFIEKNFKANAGYYTNIDGKALKPARLIDENINLARFSNLVFHYTGEKKYKAIAEHAMRYLATDAIALSTITEVGILIADSELASDPLHLCIVGSKKDSDAKTLFMAALKYPNTYKRLEWWDRSEGAMPNPDVQYPSLEKSAAYICTGKRCSLPIFKAEDLAKTIDRISGTLRGGEGEN
jgi:uncharacterized protein YyaL (SSP411 family)